MLAFPHKQSTEDLQRFLDAFLDHDTTDRLPEIAAPTLVLAGGRDPTSRPELCRAVAELIPGARFEVMEEESHQPFQEVPDEWNARVDAFWREVKGLTRLGDGLRDRAGLLAGALGDFAPDVLHRLDDCAPAGMTSKLFGGGGDCVNHSSVLPCHGSLPASLPFLTERTMFTTVTRTPMPSRNEPIVEMRL